MTRARLAFKSSARSLAAIAVADRDRSTPSRMSRTLMRVFLSFFGRRRRRRRWRRWWRGRTDYRRGERTIVAVRYERTIIGEAESERIPTGLRTKSDGGLETPRALRDDFRRR